METMLQTIGNIGKNIIIKTLTDSGVKQVLKGIRGQMVLTQVVYISMLKIFITVHIVVCF